MLVYSNIGQRHGPWVKNSDFFYSLSRLALIYTTNVQFVRNSKFFASIVLDRASCCRRTTKQRPHQGIRMLFQRSRRNPLGIFGRFSCHLGVRLMTANWNCAFVKAYLSTRCHYACYSQAQVGFAHQTSTPLKCKSEAALHNIQEV